MQTVNPETFICDSIFYYQVTGDKEGFDRMINEEMSSKLRAYYCGTLNYLIYPLFDINYSRAYPMFDRIYEAYDLLTNH